MRRLFSILLFVYLFISCDRGNYLSQSPINSNDMLIINQLMNQCSQRYTVMQQFNNAQMNNVKKEYWSLRNQISHLNQAQLNNNTKSLWLVNGRNIDTTIGQNLIYCDNSFSDASQIAKDYQSRAQYQRNEDDALLRKKSITS